MTPAEFAWQEIVFRASAWAFSIDKEGHDRSVACGNCGESLIFAHRVGACLAGCGELHGYDAESDLWTPAILEDRRK